MVETMRYGSWQAYGDRWHISVDGTVFACVQKHGDDEWVRRVSATGAYVQMVADYIGAINAALPEHVTLRDNEFFGPARHADYTWPMGEFSITDTVKSVDLDKIVKANDPDL